MRRGLLLLPLFVASVMTSIAADKEILISSAGSTFIYPILSQWIKAYEKDHPGVRIVYDPVGSGHGINRTLSGLVDFGASDGPLTDAQLKSAKDGVVHIPVTLGAVVPAYNLPGVSEELRFTPEALAGVFLGQIKKWSDPELASANPGMHLPDHAISVIYRRDGSGTTYVWTDFLSKTSPEWKKRVGYGTSVSFPVGWSAAFNEGVVEEIKKAPYSIGYIQLSYALANHVQFGRVQNPLGDFVKADPGTITAAAAGTATNMPADFRVSITNSSDEAAYPISSFTWLLVPARVQDPAKRQAIVDFVRWTLTDGQKFAGPLNYAPLPTDVAKRVLEAVSKIH